MNRFTLHGNRRLFPNIRIIYFVCPVLIIIFVLCISSINESTVSKQQLSLEAALNRDIIHCYAVEGFYPPSLEYIEDHYGLMYNKKLFFVDYQPIGSNMRPDITVLTK